MRAHQIIGGRRLGADAELVSQLSNVDGHTQEASHQRDTDQAGVDQIALQDLRHRTRRSGRRTESILTPFLPCGIDAAQTSTKLRRAPAALSQSRG